MRKVRLYRNQPGWVKITRQTGCDWWISVKVYRPTNASLERLRRVCSTATRAVEFGKSIEYQFESEVA